MAKYTAWLDRLIERIAPLPSISDYPAQLQQAQQRLETLDRLADTEPDSLRAAAYRSVWRTMGEELGFVVADLDRGRLNDEALTTAVEQWENYGRVYLAQNAISADSVFPQPEGAVYDPAGDVALARDAIRSDLRQAEAGGDQHRAAALRDFDAQLNSMVELYTLQAADHRSQGREETTEHDREVFRRELGEHAAYFSGKVHPGPEIALPSDLLPMLPSYDPGLWERHQQVFSATMGWSSNVRHPILNSTQYEPPASSSAVRDHAAALHACALAEAKHARADGRTARQAGLNDFADDVVMLLRQYEARAAASPGQGDEELDRMDRYVFADAVEHGAGLGNAILSDDDAIVPPEQLRIVMYELADDEDPADAEARLTLRSHKLFPGRGQTIDAGAELVVAAVLDQVDSVDDAFALVRLDLGHRAVIVGLSQQADRAVAVGDFELAARYRELADQIIDHTQSDEYAVVEGALRAADRRGHIAEQQTQTQARLHEQVVRHGLVLPDSTTDQHDGDAIERDSEEMIDNEVQHAYDMIVSERSAQRQFDLEAPNDHDPVDLAQLKARLTFHSRLSGVTPHASERIDEALQRLTTNQAGPRAELLDYDHRGEQRATVRLITDTDTDTDTDGAAVEEAGDADELPDDEYDAERRQEIAAELEAAEHNDPQRSTEKVAGQLNEQAAGPDVAGDTEDVKRLPYLAGETYQVPDAWEAESGITPEPWQVEAREKAEAEASAAQEADDLESGNQAAVDEHADDEQDAAARDEVEQVDDAVDRGDDADDNVKEVTETSACSVAVSRAETVVAQMHEHLDSEERRVEQAERDEELARWHADDTGTADTGTAATAPVEQTVEDRGPVMELGSYDD